jgi:hypothetical protein
MNAPVHFDPASDVATTPLDRIDVSDPRLYQNDIYYPYFERLRRGGSRALPRERDVRLVLVGDKV